jgi:hypothetical protein
MNVKVDAIAPAVPPETGASWKVGGLGWLEARTAFPMLKDVAMSMVELQKC